MIRINNQEPNICDYIDGMRSHTYTNVGLAERIIKTLSQPESFINRYIYESIGKGPNPGNRVMGIYKCVDVRDISNLYEISALLRRCDVDDKFIENTWVKDQFELDFMYMKLRPDTWVITHTNIRVLDQNFFLHETM